MLFVTVVLVGAGWSFLKPSASYMDQLSLVAVLVLQLWVNAGQVVMIYTSRGSTHFQLWEQVFRLCDLARCVVALVPAVATIRHISAHADVFGAGSVSLVWGCFWLLTCV